MKKRNIKRISQLEYMIMFLMVIGGIGIASFARLISYYDTGTVENNEWTVELGSRLETDIATTFMGKIPLVDLNGAVHRALGQREMNGVVKLDNGHLLVAFGYAEDKILQHNADQVIELKKNLDEKGIELLYVIPPYASNKYDPQLPEGIRDYGNDNLDRFSDMLREGGVELLDIRETMHDDGINAYDMMYRTDHHWTTRAGFYAYTQINDILMQKLDCEVDERVMDLSNYSVTTYPRWHLGSYGQRTGACFAGIDDFDLIEPVFETHVSNGTESGSYGDIVINKEALKRKDQTSRYTYDGVLGRSCEKNFVNEQASNDKKILVITDSYGKAVNPFLILSYGEVRTLMDEYSEIGNYRPDAVVIIYYINNVMNDEAYDFDIKLE